MTLIPGIGMIIVGVAFIAVWKRKTHLSFIPFLFGALLWVIGVSMKFAVAIPVNQRFLKFLLTSLHPYQAEIIFYTYVGLLTGVFECVTCYLIIKYSRLRDYDFDNAVAFGIGFGAIEAILLGMVPLVQFIGMGGFPHNSSLGMIAIPIVERFFTIFVHVYCSVLIIYSLKDSKISYFLLSFLIKTLIDGLAAWFMLGIAHSDTTTWTMEAVVMVFGILCVYGLYRMRSENKLTTDVQLATESIPNAS